MIYSTLSIAQSELIVNQDSLEFYQNKLIMNFKDEADFTRQCGALIKYEGGYDYVLDNIDMLPRHPITHEYFLGYLYCFVKNKNEAFIDLFKDRIERNQIDHSTINNTILKIFDNTSEACTYINSLVENKNLSTQDRIELQQKVDYVKNNNREFQGTCH